MKAEELKSYEIIEKRKIADIDSMVTLCRHRKTGANVVLISNDDDNKVLSDSALRLKTPRAWRISWSTPCSAVPGNSR